MVNNTMSRRNYLKLVGAGTPLAASAMSLGYANGSGIAGAQSETSPPPTAEEVADRTRRMKWWREAKFGMFIHWGLYSLHGRRVWAMDMEGRTSVSVKFGLSRTRM